MSEDKKRLLEIAEATKEQIVEYKYTFSVSEKTLNHVQEFINRYNLKSGQDFLSYKAIHVLYKDFKKTRAFTIGPRALIENLAETFTRRKTYGTLGFYMDLEAIELDEYNIDKYGRNLDEQKQKKTRTKKKKRSTRKT